MTLWRADHNGQFWFIGTDMKVYTDRDTRSDEDNSWYDAGNYFVSETKAAVAAECLKSVLGYLHDGNMDKAIEMLVAGRKIVKEDREQ